MLNSHCNNNGKNYLKKKKKKNMGPAGRDPRYTDCKTAVLPYTTLRSSVQLDKNAIS